MTHRPRHPRTCLRDAACAAMLLAAAPVCAQTPVTAAEPDVAGAARAAADDLAALLSDRGRFPEAAGVDAAAFRTSIEAAIARLAEAHPELTPALPQTLAQAAHLALTAEHPASRATMVDMTRDVLGAVVDLGGTDPAAEAVTAAWALADPVVQSAEQQQLTAADVAGFDRLQQRAGHAGTISAQEFWTRNAGDGAMLMFPARLNAWAAGVEAAWTGLDADQQLRAARVLEVEAVPDPALLEPVIGTADMIGWLAGTDVPLTPAEQAGAPDLLRFMQSGAFAGALAPALAARAMAGAAMATPSPAAGQLMRLNNWSAMTGESSSWESYRYMTQGQ